MWREDYKAGVIDRYTALHKLGEEADESLKGVLHPSATAGNPQSEPVTTEEIEQQRRLEAAAESIKFAEEEWVRKSGKFNKYVWTGGYAASRANAVVRLRAIADEGKIEAGYGFDRTTGRSLAYAEADAATPDELKFRPEDFAGHDDYAILHCHRDATPPGADDWEALLSNQHLNESVVVTTESTYTFEKDETRPAQAAEPRGKAFLFFQAKLEKLRRAQGDGKTAFSDLPEPVRNALLWQTNQWMAELYKVKLKREKRS